ncbi:MAG: murein biosynthesis integral membrane protein MurJ [Phycisphaerales bacterium]|nr:murein biosynthesis integral membrane protein MurJ [Phycisphaerales bacterium]
MSVGRDQLPTFVSRPHRFVGSAKLIAALTLASRVLGVVRENAYAQFFGASPLLSAFRIAFQIPNLARRLFGEGALTASFIPVFAQARADDGDVAARRLAGGVFTLLTAALLALLAFGEGVLLVIWAWQPEPHPAVSLTILLLPYMLLICLTAFFGGILNAEHRFAAPAIAPTILNVVLISAVWGGGKLLDLDTHAHMRLVAWAALFAGVLQLGLQWVWLRSCGFRLAVNFDWRSPGVRRIMLLMAPMLIGMSALQINTFFDSMIAFFCVPDGRGPAILGYSQYASNLPLGFSARRSRRPFSRCWPGTTRRRITSDLRSVEAGLRTSLFVSVPAGVGLILVAQPLVRLLFESELFTASDTDRVVLALRLYCLGIWSYAVQQMLVRAFHSMQNSRTPVRIAGTMVAVNFVLNLVLVHTRLWEAGVALATATTATAQALILAYKLHGQLIGMRWRRVAQSMIKCAIATGLMGVAVWIVGGHSPVGAVLPQGDLKELLGCVVVGAGVYLAATWALRMEEGAIILGRRKSLEEAVAD